MRLDLTRVRPFQMHDSHKFKEHSNSRERSRLGFKCAEDLHNNLRTRKLHGASLLVFLVSIPTLAIRASYAILAILRTI